MDNKVIVNAEGLQLVSTELANNSEKMYSLYTKDIVAVLESCQEELKVSGLNYSEVTAAYKNLFDSLRSQLNELVNALNTTIIPSYEIAAQTINKQFNSDFANQINEYLTIMRRD